MSHKKSKIWILSITVDFPRASRIIFTPSKISLISRVLAMVSFRANRKASWWRNFIHRTTISSVTRTKLIPQKNLWIIQLRVPWEVRRFNGRRATCKTRGSGNHLTLHLVNLYLRQLRLSTFSASIQLRILSTAMKLCLCLAQIKSIKSHFLPR